MKIEIKYLNKAYGDKVVFQNLNLTFELSGITAIMAPSGKGKTTLLHILSGIEKYDSGEITGVPSVSVMFQEDRLLPWLTAKENISIVSDSATAEKLLINLGLENEINEYPKNLSGGMKRRVALARAIAFDSELLILDEPLKGLDEDLKAKVEAMLIQISRQRPIITVTHEKTEANDLNAVIVEI